MEPHQTRNDYFTAPFSPKTKAWLSVVEGRHAGEMTWSAFRAGNYAEALGDCMYTLARFPNHPGALFLLGEIAKATHQSTMPIAYFEDALKMYPQYAYTHAQYGHYLVGIGATAAGIAELREALRMDPNLLQARAWLAEARPPVIGLGPMPADSVNATPPDPSTARRRDERK